MLSGRWLLLLLANFFTKDSIQFKHYYFCNSREALQEVCVINPYLGRRVVGQIFIAVSSVLKFYRHLWQSWDKTQEMDSCMGAMINVASNER